MRAGISIAVVFAVATMLASGGGGYGMAVAASEAVSTGGESVPALPDSPSRNHQNVDSTGGAHRTDTTQPGQEKSSNHAAGGPFADTFDISTGPTNPNSPDLGFK